MTRAGKIYAISMILVVLLFPLIAVDTRAGSVTVSVTDSITNSGSGNSYDWSATHSITQTSSDLNFAIRNGSDSTSFTYRITGQASADSTLFTGEDYAWVSGLANFGFTLPTGASVSALWNLSLDVSYKGVAASDGSSSSANAGNLSVSSTGVASGMALTFPGTGNITNNTVSVDTYAGAVKNNVSPGSGTVSLDLDLGAHSWGTNGGEAIAAIGQTSTMGSFEFNNRVDTASDGIFITVTMTPHLNFNGQTLNSDLSLTSGENLNGSGYVNGNITGVAGSSITTNGLAGSVLSLGNSASTSGFDFSGTLNVGKSTVTLYDSDYAYLRGTATLGGGLINAAKGLNLGSTGKLSGYGTVNGPVSGSAGSSITASGGELSLGNAASANGFNFGGTLNVEGYTVNLLDSNYADLGGTANLGSPLGLGVINAANGLNLGSTGKLSGYGTVNGPVSGSAGSSITASGNLTLGDYGDYTRASGINFAGTLNVGPGSTVTLRDYDWSDLSGTVNLGGEWGGGLINAAKGLNLGSTGKLSGSGTVNGSVSGSAGASIIALWGGLTLGGLNFDGALNVGESRVTLNYGPSKLGISTTLAGGILIARNGMLIDGSDTISGYGVIVGDVSGTNFPAGMLIAAPTGTVSPIGTLDVGASNAAIYSQEKTSIGTLLLSGGNLNAANGIQLGDWSHISGYGTVNADIAGVAGSHIATSGGGLTLGNAASANGFIFSGTLDVGSNTVTLRDSDLAELGISTTLAGGSLIAPNGVSIDGTDTISGYGIIRGQISGTNAAAGLVPTGTVNLSSSPFTVGPQDDITVLTQDALLLGNTTLEGGTLRSTAGVQLVSGAKISGTGNISSDVYGEAGSKVVAKNGNLALGDSASFTGFRTLGNIEVGSNSLTLNSRGFSTLGFLNTLAGGTLSAPNGMFLEGGSTIAGHGSVNGRLAARTGSLIVADGDLALGDVNALDGYYSQGVLEVGNHVVTINDRNEGVLGSLTTLGNAGGGGTLNSANGLLLSEGNNLSGYGVVNGRFVNQGYVLGQGTVLSDLIRFTGAVTGHGDFGGNILFEGTYSPGNSPAIVSFENLAFGNDAILEIEIGGLNRGSEYDALVGTGSLSLDGTLDVIWLWGFTASSGDVFDIFDWGWLLGAFDNINLPVLSAGLYWNTSRLYVDGTLFVAEGSAPVPEPATMVLLGLGLVGLAGFRKTIRKSQSTETH